MRDLVVESVVDGVWCLRRRSYLTCSYLVHRPGGFVLIDTGMDSQARDVAAGLAAAGGTFDEVCAVVLTHWHNDHAAGARETQARSGAKVYCGQAEVPFVVRETRRPGWIGSLGDRWPERGPLVLAKGLLTNAPRRAVEEPVVAADSDEIEGLQVVATPGHTPGHISVWEPDRRILFTGDALAVVGGSIRHMSRSVTPDRDEAKRSMQRVIELEPAIICPGHRAPIQPSAADLNAAGALVANDRWPIFG